MRMDFAEGDNSDQYYDADIDGIHPSVYLRSSDKCNYNRSLDQLAKYTDASSFHHGVSRVTLYISNEHVRITNDQGLDEYLCHECLFALAGQKDQSTGLPNDKIFIALNRVILARADRTGKGICKAKLSWVCKPVWH